MSSPGKPTAGFWVTVALVGVLVGYPLSFGPACWWFAKPKSMFGPVLKEECAPAIYWPIGWLAWKCPGSLRNGIDWYATAGIKSVNIPTDHRGARYHRSQ